MFPYDKKERIKKPSLNSCFSIQPCVSYDCSSLQMQEYSQLDDNTVTNPTIWL
jgi:hypothetical protein